MKHLLKAIILLAVFISACSMSELGAPPPDPEDRWVKSGYTKSQIRLALNMCGQNEPWSIQSMEKIDWCMLQQGFVFIDSPYQHVHKRCDSYAPYKNLPSCRSLRGELSSSTIQNSPSKSSEVIENSQKFQHSITIVPSASPTVTLQEQVQKNSNTQMNQMLQAPGFRK